MTVIYSMASNILLLLPCGFSLKNQTVLFEFEVQIFTRLGVYLWICPIGLKVTDYSDEFIKLLFLKQLFLSRFILLLLFNFLKFTFADVFLLLDKSVALRFGSQPLHCFRSRLIRQQHFNKRLSLL